MARNRCRFVLRRVFVGWTELCVFLEKFWFADCSLAYFALHIWHPEYVRLEAFDSGPTAISIQVQPYTYSLSLRSYTLNSCEKGLRPTAPPRTPSRL